MEEGKNNGIKVFLDFVKSVPEDESTFDYFSLLDHISQNKLDRDNINNLLAESKLICNLGNKQYEATKDEVQLNK